MINRPRTPVMALRVLLSSVVFAACLSGCAQFNPSPFMPEPYSYEVPYPDDAMFDFENYVVFGDGVADKWDPKAKLESISRQTLCATIELTSEQKMLFQYWRPQLYWFGQRIEWLDIYIAEKADAEVAVSTSLSASWDKQPVDFGTLVIDYETALRMAFDQGGAVYEASHPDCYLSISLAANQWYFAFSVDRGMVSDDVLRICIDGVTGESCPFPHEAARPDEVRETS